MDRLSAYATREAESQSPEQRARKEEEAARQLMEKLNMKDVSGTEDAHTPDAPPKPAEANGDEQPEASDNQPPEPADREAVKDTNTTETGIEKPVKGIPEDVKLYEIFYEQVLNLVNVRAHTRQFGNSAMGSQTDFRVSSKAQNLPIQDIIALLVSLANLALKIYPDRLGMTYNHFPPTKNQADSLRW